ncbi:Putative Chitin synthase [Rhizopus microsporus]|nr:Putative Chitin synthase [Rhizopus microsporus]
MDQALFQVETDVFRAEGIHVPDINYQSTALDLLTRPKGICHEVNTMTDVSKRAYTDNNIMDSIIKFNSTHPAFSVKNSDTNARHFVVQHFGNTPVEYSTEGFIAQNNNQISVDFLSLFKGGMDVQPSWNSFVVELFANVKTQSHPKHTTAIISAQQSAKPMRAPSQRKSTRRTNGNNGSNEKGGSDGTGPTTVLAQIQSALDELIESLGEAKLWVVYCILPKLKESGNFDTKLVQSQIDMFKIPSLLQLPTIQYVESYGHHEFLEHYGHLFEGLDTTRLLRSQCEMAAGIMGWTAPNMSITQNKVFLSAIAWRELEDKLRSYEKVEQRQAKDSNKEGDTGSVSHPFAAAAAAAGLPLPPQNYYDNDHGSFYSEDESGQYMEQEGSFYGSESYGSHQGGLALIPQQAPVFNSDAQCKTNAPDTWSVLVSQRRRWINSTIHNLGELVFLPRLCGFCCFSMRFVVLLDLISTAVMPALLGYLGYLIYTLATWEGSVPIISIATIAGTYGLQALLFIIKGRWEFIMWMIVSLFAMPVFSFYIPIYSYWHFDDFSWGNTRIVVGEKGKKVAVTADEGTFDPKSIPTMKWSEYEQQILSEDRWSDNVSQSSGYTHGSRGNYPRPGPGSVYGAASGMMMMPDNMSVHSSSRSVAQQQQQQQARQTMGFDHNSMIFPSSASTPMMPYTNNSTSMLPSSRSMASFAPAQQFNTPGQYIPLQNSSQFNKAGSSRSLMMDGFNTEGPKNEEIMQQVQRILETADLTKVTKKQVREELQNIFGVSMQSRKDYINACIESVLQNRV